MLRSVFVFMVSCGLVFAMSSVSVAQLNKGERVVFLGDSITQAGARPNGYVSIFRNAVEKHHADLGVEVIGAGISGHKVPDLQKRLKRDVLDKKPTLVVIYIGINDVWHSQSGRGTSKEDYESGLVDIIGQIQAVDAKVVLCTPSVIGEKHDGSNKLDKMLEEYSAISRSVAKKTNASLLDLRKQFVDYLKKNNPDNKDKNVLTTDGVHLNQKGNNFVAHQMLMGLGVGSGHQNGKVLRHMVMFKFNDGLEQEKIDEVVKEFAALKDQIETIVDYEQGTNISEENLSQGFTHCFLVTFKDVAGRDAYLPHPAHKKFVEFIGGKIDKVLVVDYWTK